MAHEGCTAIEDHSDFVGLLRVVHSMVEDVPQLSIIIVSLFMWHLLSITLFNNVLHECHVIWRYFVSFSIRVFNLFSQRRANVLLFGSFGVLNRKGSGIS